MHQAAAQSPRLNQKAAALRLLFFGPVRTLLETEAHEIPWPTKASVGEFWTLLLRDFPQLQSARSTIRLARENEFLTADAHLHPGDEIALIPPVSGG